MRLLRWLLAPLAPLYGSVVKARNRAFDAHPERASRVSVPVISIGNLTLGGTGKTPVTLFLAEGLRSRGFRPTILSRGYGGRRAVDPMDVTPQSNPREVGDEPRLMADRLGGSVVVGRKRLNAALRALSQPTPPDLLLLDDGFQHRALHRDVNLLLLDGVRTWGNGRMVPLGDLREPLAAARRADILVVTRGSRANQEAIHAWWDTQGSGGPIVAVDFRIQALRDAHTGARRLLPWPTPPPFLAFCALGHPEAFFADLLVAGLPWLETATLRDHQPFSPGDLKRLARQAQVVGAEALVCTEKDAVKFTPEHLQACPLPLWIAEQSLEGGEPLLEEVLKRIRALAPRS